MRNLRRIEFLAGAIRSPKHQMSHQNLTTHGKNLKPSHCIKTVVAPRLLQVQKLSVPINHH